MNELTSTEFRKRFARLKEPVVVTANGHPIGTWLPEGPTLSAEEAIGLVEAAINAPPNGITFAQLQDLKMATAPALAGLNQAQRDELLRKINRKS